MAILSLKSQLTLWEEDLFYQLARGCCHLIAHTRRLTVAMGEPGQPKNFIETINHVHKRVVMSKPYKVAILQPLGNSLHFLRSLPSGATRSRHCR
jgi:hypothetical protein